MKSILKRRHCRSVVIEPSGVSVDADSGIPPHKRKRMMTEFTVGRDGSPTKIIKEELIKNFPSIVTPIVITDSPEPSPEKKPPIIPTIECINDFGERGPPQEVNFCDQVLKYEFQCDTIKKTIRGRVSSLPSTQERLEMNEKRIENAKSPERREYYEQVKSNLEARSKKVHALNYAEAKAKAALSKTNGPQIDYADRERVKQEEIIKWKYQEHLVKYLGRWIRCSLRDRECQEPTAPVTSETRHCLYCLVEVDLHIWAEHIQSRWHVVSFHSNRWLNKFCWYKNKDIGYHSWQYCEECQNRLYDLAEETYLYHEASTYNADNDIEAKRAILLFNSPTTYVCTICDMTCFTEDFYKKHLGGRKHRENVTRINNGGCEKEKIQLPLLLKKKKKKRPEMKKNKRHFFL